MAPRSLRRLLPAASADVLAVLDTERGTLEAPLRSELFGSARFAQHGRSLAAAHATRAGASPAPGFVSRLRANVRVLREAYALIGDQSARGQFISPAGEWLLDNFHLVEEQIQQIRDGLPMRYFRDLPVLADQHLAGLPRIYGVAWAFVAHTDSAFDEALLNTFIAAYTEYSDLTLGELWALPTTLRIVLIENLRRLCEQVATAKAAREAAHLCCDHDDVDLEALAELHRRLLQRGVGRAFALQVAQRAADHPAGERLRAWLAEVLLDPAAAQAEQQAEQVANNLSVSNVLTALRVLGDADWRALTARNSRAIRMLDANPVFRAESDTTRDITLQAIDRLARRSERSEADVAHALLGLTHLSAPGHADADAGRAPLSSVPDHWLRGAGRARLYAELGLDAAALHWQRAGRRLRLPLYLAVMTAATLALTYWVLTRFGVPQAGWPPLALVAALALLPASEAVVATVNRLISESARPRRLSRLALNDGIDAAQRVMVTIPAMLTGHDSGATLARQLELHHLANPEPWAQFALLTDWADAPERKRPGDAALLRAAQHAIEALNERLPALPDGQPRFLLLHRERRWCETERRWLGWERKRGKLEELVHTLADPAHNDFIDLGALSRPAPGTPYLVTLDSDTLLPPGTLRALVGVAAHPLNRPHFDTSRRHIVTGYGILQPRLATPLPDPAEATRYHWLFAGALGMDPYSAASSEVYQDLFDEGTFTGKGLLDVQAVHAVLGGRLPEGRVLSHDLLEGSIARCATLSDIALVEDAPVHADVAASRVHRWTRGDWQLLPFLARAGRFGIRAVNRWKMLDNLRRSLVAPASLLLLLLSLATGALAPGAALALVAAAFGAGPLLGALAAFSPSRDDVALRHFYRLAGAGLARALLGALWHIALLLQQALLLGDAVLRTLWRMAVSRRHLLQWTTAAAAQAAASTELRVLWRRHARVPVVAVLLAAGLLAAGAPPLALLLCALWAAAPLWTWWVSRPARPAVLPAQVRSELLGVARDTWRLFERVVCDLDHHLPPDNLQTRPQTMVAHRTSPTNIGLYLLSAACARRFGWIGSEELVERCERTLATLDALPRHRGHFLNWYDTVSLQALTPPYVSTVDSGNLSACLLALGQACREGAEAPYDRAAALAALAASRERLQPLRAGLRELASGVELEALVFDAAAIDRVDVGRLALLDVGMRQADALQHTMEDGAALGAVAPALGQQLLLCLHDHLATLRSAWRDARAGNAGETLVRQRLLTLAARCDTLAWAPEFGFLYDERRRLLRIGFRVTEQQLDDNCYDLLASEARVASLLAIAKGDVPVRHWAALGRPFFASGYCAALRSWSGSMFEYLMPGLLLDEPAGSVLQGAAHAALREQRLQARAQGQPWGVSESAYAERDHTLAYQYGPQGVQSLALRRMSEDERVIAPYASAMAAQIDPVPAWRNLRALELLGARSVYGFIESLDYTPARRAEGEAFVPVATFMAHHQGMSIVALANALLGQAPRRWCMSVPRVRAVATLLHERVPREVPVPNARPRVAQPAERHAPVGPWLSHVPGMAALPPTHLLSNGRYMVALRPDGSGWSRHGAVDISRWRDDALRGAHGSFFYLRRQAAAAPVSLSYHPAPDPAAHYSSSAQADRVCLTAQWPDLETRCTVWVSPEDDIELRRIELRNTGDLAIDLELMSCFEVALAESRADEAHPAFANLFVRALWDAAERALYFERKPRLAGEAAVHAVHFLALADEPVASVQVQTDRARWVGRGRSMAAPLARYEAGVPAAAPVEQVTGLDPVAALSVRLTLMPSVPVQLVFATASGASAEQLGALVDKYRERANVERASMMSATLAGIRLRELRITPELFAAAQMFATTVSSLLARPLNHETRAGGSCDRRLLWRFGISGDRPIILVRAAASQALPLLRALAQALRLWSWGGLGCDLVVLNNEPASYLMPLQREITALREACLAFAGAVAHPAFACGFHVLRHDELSDDERATLTVLARLRLSADGRPLAQHLQELQDWHERFLDARQVGSVQTLASAPLPGAPARAPLGRFDAASGGFSFEVDAAQRPARPWINVLANAQLGTQVSEAGAGYTWAGNSRMHQITPWSNDPVCDPAGEWLLLHEARSQRLWNVGAAGDGAAPVTYRIEHGPGWTRIAHSVDELDVDVQWCVDGESAVKQMRLAIVNRSARRRRLRTLALAEWMMGAQRADRISTVTAAEPGDSGSDAILYCTQCDRVNGFGGATAFLALSSISGAPDDVSADWSCDRREFFDARGRLVLPDQLGQRSGAGLDPCAALAAPFTVPAQERVELVFLLGHAESPEAARLLARQALREDAARRQKTARAQWRALQDSVQVDSPDPLFNALVNHWLLYQTLACRMWARAGFYQAGGAFGFRDQLQDAMALAVAAPQRLRSQILLNASRQFLQGDVQHWWHAPTGAGVRTRFSDDLLWLVAASLRYLEVSGDASLLDERAPFLDSAPVPDGAEDRYDQPARSGESASVYEHCARAIDRSLAVGVHGLPLMGTGDWNDGMNRVGHEGRGESIWLGWFLCAMVDGLAPIAHARGDADRARRWEAAARGWRAALNDAGWDGAWFRRAFFDDGSPLGSQANSECRIDLIAQAWAVLSGATDVARQTQAMRAVDERLFDRAAGTLKLLDPPLANARPNAGYIQAYPPGVRENGGQYSHAGVWAVMAFAELGQADLAYRLFTCLSPAHRTAHAQQGAAYGLEPYVMAGDVYTQAPYVGRGGWSWYTGSAGWMHRAAIESICGLLVRGERVCLRPHLPRHWTHVTLRLRRDGRLHEFIVCASTAVAAADEALQGGAQRLSAGEWLRLADIAAGQRCVVIADAAAAPTGAQPDDAQSMPVDIAAMRASRPRPK